MYFDAAMVFVKKTSLLFRLALAILCDILYEKCGLPRLLCMSFDALSLLVSIVVGLAEVAFHFFSSHGLGVGLG